MRRQSLSRLVSLMALSAGLALAPGAGRAQPAPRPELDAPRAIVPAGRLRMELYPGTPTSLLVDAGGADPRGVGHDLGLELARRLGVPFEPVVLANNAEVLAAMKAGRVDLAFTNATPARAGDRAGALPFLGRFTEAARKEGVIRKAVERAGLRGALPEQAGDGGGL
jgi:polar amino acid transport system substrate-binding protein